MPRYAFGKKSREMFSSPTRREFLKIGGVTGMALLAGKTGYEQAIRDSDKGRLFQRFPSRPGNASSGSRTVLDPVNDFTYLGFFGMPDSMQNFSWGFIDCYVTGGDIHILIAGPNQTAAATPMLAEYLYPGVGTSLADGFPGMPTATRLYYWNDLYQRTASQLTGTPAEATMNNGLMYAGSDFGNTNEIFVSYCNRYTGGIVCPTLIRSTLNRDGNASTPSTNTCYGPWGYYANGNPASFLGAQVTQGNLKRLPSSMQTAMGITDPLVVGAMQGGQINGCFQGPGFSSFTPGSLGATADTPGGSTWTLGTKQLIFNTSAVPGDVSLYPNNWQLCNCRRDDGGSGNQASCLATESGLTTAPNIWGGYAANQDSVDNIEGLIPIDTGKKWGLIGTALVSRTLAGVSYGTLSGQCHMWYGGSQCWHTDLVCHPTAAYGMTGPASHTGQYIGVVYDPQQMINGYLGTGGYTIYNQTPNSMMKMTDWCGGQFAKWYMSPNAEFGTYFYNQAGIAYEPTNGYLFICSAQGQAGPKPIIHVIQVNQS
jgi:hypothetical protein